MVDVTSGRLALPIPEDSDPVGLLPETFRDMASQLESQQAMIGFAATWTGSSSNPSQGNGDFRAVYRYIGYDLITGYVWARMGSTTSYGGGNWRLALPKPALQPVTAGVPIPFSGEGWATDSGIDYRIYGRVQPADPSQISLKCDGTTAGGSSRNLTPTVPFTFGTGDEFYLRFMYQTDGTL